MKKQLATCLAVLFLFTSCVKGRASDAPTAGRIEENIYTSTYTDIRFTGDANWQLATAREVAEITANDLANGTILDMQATYTYVEGTPPQLMQMPYTINVYYRPKQQGDITFETADAYLASHRESIISTQMALDSIYEYTEIAPYTLAGTGFVYYANHMPMVQSTCYFFAKEADDNYILFIAIQLPDNFPIAQVTNMFTALP